jgi:hypothetical protein
MNQNVIELAVETKRLYAGPDGPASPAWQLADKVLAQSGKCEETAREELAKAEANQLFKAVVFNSQAARIGIAAKLADWEATGRFDSMDAFLELAVEATRDFEGPALLQIMVSTAGSRELLKNRDRFVAISIPEVKRYFTQRADREFERALAQAVPKEYAEEFSRKFREEAGTDATFRVTEVYVSPDAPLTTEQKLAAALEKIEALKLEMQRLTSTAEERLETIKGMLREAGVDTTDVPSSFRTMIFGSNPSDHIRGILAAKNAEIARLSTIARARTHRELGCFCPDCVEDEHAAARRFEELTLEAERLRPIETELEKCASLMTRVHPMGVVKAIGLREVFQALSEIVSEHKLDADYEQRLAAASQREGT